MIRRSNELNTAYKSSFFSYEKSIELILKKLFVDNSAYANEIKRLLVINKPDCLSKNNAAYEQLIKGYNVKRLREEGYVRTVPRLNLKEHEDIKSFIFINLDDFAPSSNQEYRDTTLSFYVFCEYDYAQMDNYEYRPIKIAGYIDGVMNKAKLTNIGRLNFLGAQQVPLNEYWGGVVLMYAAQHNEQEDKNPNIPEK